MTKDQFIKELEHIAESGSNEMRLGNLFDLVITQDRDSRWISVKERLPEDGQMVLIQSTDNAMFPVVSRYRKSHKLQFIIPYRSDLDVKNVTHWQPLPEAPKL